MIASIPSLVNIPIETFYSMVNEYYYPVWGSIVGSVVTLSSVLLFMNADNLNGLTLGLSISIGSCIQSLFYLIDLYRKGHLIQYHLFQSFPLQYIKQYLQDSCIYVLTSSVFLKYLLLVSLFAAEYDELNLTAYFVALGSMYVTSLCANIISIISGHLFFGFALGYWFYTGTAVGIVSVAASLITSTLLAIPLMSIGGQALAELFIDIQNITENDRSDFYDNVQEYSYFLIILSLIYSIRSPVATYLFAYLAYYELVKISLVCEIILPIIIVAIIYGSGSDSIEATFAGVLGSIFLGAIWSLYEWLRISDFYCDPTREEPVVDSSSLCCDFSTFFKKRDEQSFCSVESNSEENNDAECDEEDPETPLLPKRYGTF